MRRKTRTLNGKERRAEKRIPAARAKVGKRKGKSIEGWSMGRIGKAALVVEAVQKKVGHDFYAERNAPFIRIKIRAVERSHCAPIRILDSQKEKEPRDFLAVFGEIFGNHLGLEAQDI